VSTAPPWQSRASERKGTRRGLSVCLRTIFGIMYNDRAPEPRQDRRMTQPTPFPVHIVGVPMDLGQSRRGVDMGPSAVRYAGLQKRLVGLGLQVIDGGNVATPVVEEIDEDPS